MATPGFECSCVARVAAACRENPRCNARPAQKYAPLPRRVLLPPQLVAPCILSFFLEFGDVLRDGVKIETRRQWAGSALASHTQGLDNKLFVRVWCGGKGKQIGYCVYHRLYEQRLGHMTAQNLIDEGRGKLTLGSFVSKYMGGCTFDSVVTVVRFTFIPFV